MADAKTLEFLRSCIGTPDGWQNWHRFHDDHRYGGLYYEPNKYIDLSGANLQGCALAGYDFKSVDFREANLSGADLSMANLSGAELSQVNFQNANLSGANLTNSVSRQTRFVNTNLQGANLSNTDLSSSYFEGGNLIETDFKGANLREADLRRVNLSGSFIQHVKWGNYGFDHALFPDPSLYQKELVDRLITARQKIDPQLATSLNVSGIQPDQTARFEQLLRENNFTTARIHEQNKTIIEIDADPGRPSRPPRSR